MLSLENYKSRSDAARCLFTDTYLGNKDDIYEKHIVCGEFTERYEYFPPLKRKKFKKCNNRVVKHKGKERKRESLILASSRRAKNIRRLIYSNITDDTLFITLTYNENMQDEYLAKEHINSFIRDLNFLTGKKNKYIWVLERQRRGSCHFHLILFDTILYQHREMYDNKLTKERIWSIWGRGITDAIEAKTIVNLARYLSSYTSKKKHKQYQRENLDGKCFACSLGLMRPSEFIQYDYVKSSRISGHQLCQFIFPVRYNSDPSSFCVYSLYTDRIQDLKEPSDFKFTDLKRDNPKKCYPAGWEWSADESCDPVPWYRYFQILLQL